MRILKRHGDMKKRHKMETVSPKLTENPALTEKPGGGAQWRSTAL